MKEFDLDTLSPEHPLQQTKLRRLLTLGGILAGFKDGQQSSAAVSIDDNGEIREVRIFGADHTIVVSIGPPESKEAYQAREAYRNDSFSERACDHCGKLYRGPAVYCCRECAEADA